MSRIVAAHVVRRERPQIMRGHADRHLGEHRRKVSVRRILLQRIPVQPEWFVISAVDQAVPTIAEYPFVEDLADFRRDTTRLRRAARLLRFIDNDGTDDRLLHSAAAGGTVRRKIMCALSYVPDPLRDIPKPTPLHQTGKSFVLVLRRQRRLVSKVAHDHPHRDQARFRDTTMGSQSEKSRDIVGRGDGFHAPGLVGMKHERLGQLTPSDEPKLLGTRPSATTAAHRSMLAK